MELFKYFQKELLKAHPELVISGKYDK